jgi:hypothetical protein
MEKLDENKSFFRVKKKKKERRPNLGKIDILEIPKEPLHSTLFRSAILKHSSAIKSP